MSMTNVEFSDFCLNLCAKPDGIRKRWEVMADWEISFLHGAIGMASEGGELLDLAKKRLVYGKEIDIPNAMEEIGDFLHYAAYCCDALGLTFEQCREANKRKLVKRYGEGFSTEAALNRDLEGEREELEDES